MVKNLIRQDAVAVVDLLKRGDISPLELIDLLEEHTAAINPLVNAIATPCFDRARIHAEALMKKPKTERGVLAGLPVLIKDLTAVEGVRTTYGSNIFKDHIPRQSDHVAAGLEDAGGVVSGKSNTPEFGAGGNTFNDVFGATLNPWDRTRSAAGSSGGAAVALATGMAWLAHGSDLGGSLRNPASFNGVVGLRPSPFRVANGPTPDPFNSLGVEGPMARCVEDVALMLDTMTQEASRHVPLMLDPPKSSFLEAAQRSKKPKRIAFSEGLGLTPVDPEIVRVFRGAIDQLAASGIDVVESHPDLTSAHETFQILRAHAFACALSEAYTHHRQSLRHEIIWNIEQGLKLKGSDIAWAERQRGLLYQRAEAFMADFDLLLTPATIVEPYPVEERYVKSCNGIEFETYIDWLAIAYAITLTSLPALSLPCGMTGGMTSSELPVGLQVIGQPRGEADLLSYANFMQDVLGRMPTPITPK